MMRLTVSSQGFFSVLIQCVHEYLCVGMGDLEDEAYNLIPRPFSVLIQCVHEYLCVGIGDLDDDRGLQSHPKAFSRF